MRKILLLLSIIAFTGCGTSKKINTQNVEISYLDDFILSEDLEIEGTRVGGLSGMDYANGKFYLVVDHPAKPRFYEASIAINDKKIDTVIISEVVELKKSSPFLEDKTLDLEGIRVDAENNEIVLTSEGSINNDKDPAVFKVTSEGEFVSEYSIPDYFKASGEQKPRNNGVFEGLAENFSKTGYWVGMELPLVKDGSKPKLFPTKSPVRITNFNDETGKPNKQFVMQLEGITKIPWLWFAVNGLTELIEYAPERFLVLERAFSAGHGMNGNTVRIFDVDARNATNTLNDEILQKADFKPAEKRLIFDFKSVKKQLKKETIDNLEGMTFGPQLPNGNQTLLLVSDNNFNSIGKQINQIILMEVEINN